VKVGLISLVDKTHYWALFIVDQMSHVKVGQISWTQSAKVGQMEQLGYCPTLVRSSPSVKNFERRKIFC
jgi:hypothetical protein